MKRRGATIRAFAAAVFDARTMELVIDPAIADLQQEAFSVARYVALFKVVVLCVGGAAMSLRAMRCSFCRRPDAQVEKLVAGPWRLLAGRVYICDRCAAQTIQIMEGHSGDSDRRPIAASLVRRVLRRLRWRNQSSMRTAPRSLSVAPPSFGVTRPLV